MRKSPPRREVSRDSRSPGGEPHSHKLSPEKLLAGRRKVAKPPAEPAGELEIANQVARLAAPSEIDYARERKAAAKDCGITLKALDRAVAKVRAERADGTGDDLPGRALAWPEDVPWPEPIEGSSLLDEIAAVFRRCIVMTDAAVIAVAL
jgi:hypothetical protein